MDVAISGHIPIALLWVITAMLLVVVVLEAIKVGLTIYKVRLERDLRRRSGLRATVKDRAKRYAHTLAKRNADN